MPYAGPAHEGAGDHEQQRQVGHHTGDRQLGEQPDLNRDGDQHEHRDGETHAAGSRHDPPPEVRARPGSAAGAAARRRARPRRRPGRARSCRRTARSSAVTDWSPALACTSATVPIGTPATYGRPAARTPRDDGVARRRRHGGVDEAHAQQRRRHRCRRCRAGSRAPSSRPADRRPPTPRRRPAARSRCGRRCAGPGRRARGASRPSGPASTPSALPASIVTVRANACAGPIATTRAGTSSKPVPSVTPASASYCASRLRSTSVVDSSDRSSATSRSSCGVVGLQAAQLGEGVDARDDRVDVTDESPVSIGPKTWPAAERTGSTGESSPVPASRVITVTAVSTVSTSAVRARRAFSRSRPGDQGSARTIHRCVIEGSSTGSSPALIGGAQRPAPGAGPRTPRRNGRPRPRPSAAGPPRRAPACRSRAAAARRARAAARRRR